MRILIKLLIHCKEIIINYLLFYCKCRCFFLFVYLSCKSVDYRSNLNLLHMFTAGKEFHLNKGNMSIYTATCKKYSVTVIFYYISYKTTFFKNIITKSTLVRF